MLHEGLKILPDVRSVDGEICVTIFFFFRDSTVLWYTLFGWFPVRFND